MASGNGNNDDTNDSTSTDQKWPGYPLPVAIEHYTSGWNVSDLDDFTKMGKYSIQTFNKISNVGLSKFPESLYKVESAESASGPAHAILLRSHKLQESEVDVEVRAVARCGAGTNNVPVARLTELGIPVFNTPGANANAVKELILCGLLLGSRKIVQGINHMKTLGAQGVAKERVEKDKSLFGGREIKGKTLAIIGLGHIGAATARDASALGMKVQVCFQKLFGSTRIPLKCFEFSCLCHVGFPYRDMIQVLACSLPYHYLEL
jgi:D-3-phosphoglycerate dehydrogenase